MGKYKSQERYDARNTRQIRLKLNLKTDADILEHLSKVDNMQGYIKELIRADMRQGEWLMTPTAWVYCSICGAEPPNETNERTDYCPNCGSRMANPE